MTKIKGLAACALLFGCNSLVGSGGHEKTDDPSSQDPNASGALPDGTDVAALLPARIRRLTNSEYNASVQALIGTTQTPADTFPPDARQRGFTLNEAARVDPVLARQLDAAAVALADEVVARLDEFAPCADGQDAACAESFIGTFGEKAYRRPLTAEDSAALLSLYTSGATDADYGSGIHQVVRGILQSPGFLYLTEIGEEGTTGATRMTAHEIAASLSYLLTGGPPDPELVAAAEAGALATAEGRATEARRLLHGASGKYRALRVVREWLGIDRIVSTAKDANVYPSYEGLRDSMHQETESFVLEALANNGGDVRDFLGATWTIADQGLAALYGATGEGRIDVPNRPGLINRAAFLSVYAHAHETSPVLRGAAVLRRLTCMDIELPTNLRVEIVPPVPDPSLTTRQRFAIHSQDSGCASCHSLLDPLGFSFEQFDGMGAFRDTENGKQVDSSASVSLGDDFDADYPSSTELATALSTSDTVRECFARYVFRASIGEGKGAEASEDAFLKSWSALSDTAQNSLVETLVRLSSSDISVYRSQP